jgi:hypothetical protein
MLLENIRKHDAKHAFFETLTKLILFDKYIGHFELSKKTLDICIK